MQFGIWSRAAALLLAAALSGCAAQNVNPVTGKTIYTPVSAATEASVGKKAYAQMIADYGVYKEDAALAATVDRVGQALAKNVVRKSVRYTFTILDDDEINAFALPGGYVTITRGALAFANSEAEVAAILGHEIGHVDAFHFHAKGDDNAARTVLSVLLRHSGDPGDLALADRLADRSTNSTAYSKAQEFEADALSVHYMALAGYDPQGILAALHTEDAKRQLDDGGMKGNLVAHDILALDQSHPATPDREARAREAVEAEAAKDAVLAAASPGAAASSQPDVRPQPSASQGADRDAYLAAIDGMVFGADPGEGTVDGRRLVNATLGFSFEAPEDFDLWTDHSGAFGIGRNSVLVIEADEEADAGQSLVAYVESSMMKKMSVANVRPLEIDGYRAATGLVVQDAFVIRLGAVRAIDGNRGNHLYQLMYVAPRRAFNALDPGFLSSLKSFRPLAGAEATPKPPRRLKIVTVASGDTVKSLAERMSVKEKKLDWFRVLNGLAAGDEVKAGDKVKLVE
jgi:predicted Zn-dependent protease